MKKSKTFYYHVEARAYELDSYQHVNNAVFLNYMEQARWDVFRQCGVLDQLQQEGYKIVVADMNTRYGRQIELFDQVRVETKLERSGPFLVFSHQLFNNSNHQKLARAKVKTVVLDADNQATDPPKILDKLFLPEIENLAKDSSATLRRVGDLGILELDNPPKNVLLHPEFIPRTEVESMVNSGIKALVICGSGRYFSAGADLDQLQDQIKNEELFSRELVAGNQLLNYVEGLKIPVVCALAGVCFGGGLEIALSAHIRISEPQTLFAMPEVNQNLMPGMGGIRKLFGLLGEATALEICIKGDIISATDAKAIGLVDLLCEKGESKSYAIAFANKLIHDRPLPVINSIISSLQHAKTMSLEEAIEADAALFCKLASDEYKRRAGE